MSMQRKEITGITAGNHSEAADGGVWLEILRENFGRRQTDKAQVDLCIPVGEWDIRIEVKPFGL